MKAIQIIDITSGNCLNTLKGHKGPVTSIDKLSEIEIASGSESIVQTIKIWNILTGTCVMTLNPDNGLVLSLD